MDLKEFLTKGDKMALNEGVKLVEVTPEYSVTEMTVEERHLNAGGVCHGAAMFLLADFALAAVSNTSGKLTFAISCNITYHKGALLSDVLTARAEMASSHPKLPYCIIRITNQKGELIATFTGTCYSKSQPLVMPSK